MDIDDIPTLNAKESVEWEAEMAWWELAEAQDSVREAMFRALDGKQVLTATAGKTFKCKDEQLAVAWPIFSKPRTIIEKILDLIHRPETVVIDLKIQDFDIKATCLA